jgi:Carboxypeptidase regulatory-like domain
MRRLIAPTSLLCVAVFIFGKTGVTQPHETKPLAFHISGTVVNGITHAPIPHCRVMAVLSKEPQGSRTSVPDTVETDDTGHFDLPVASDGAWRLTAMAREYVTQSLDEHEGFFTAVVLSREAPTFDVRFTLMPKSTISGIVLDEANEPVRQANISLHVIPRAGEDEQMGSTFRRQAITDDRGRYELADLAPGDYRLSVQAQPWYATPAQMMRVQSGDPVPLDPSLDVVYPRTWFPGGQDPAAAATITLHGGDSSEADFQLVPIPSVHLHLTAPPTPLAPNEGQQQIRPGNQDPVRFPQIARVAENNGFFGAPPSIVATPQGQIEASGLGPGTYQVTWPNAGSDGRSSLIQITADSSRSLDLSAASAGAHLSIKADGLSEHIPLQIRFIDADDPQIVFQAFEQPNMPRRKLSGPPLQSGETASELSVDLLPGPYRVFLLGDPEVYLTGLSGKGAETTGRLVTVHGDASLTLHLARGMRKISGVVKYQEKPAAGALVLLIPASFHEPGSLTVVSRDQSDSDGSYNLAGVIPGQYILLAIDHGWQVNWNDPATLRPYLMHGIPLDLRSGGEVKQEIEAQAP